MSTPIIVTAKLTIAADPSGWTSEYGTPPEQVRADVARYFSADQLVHHLRDVAFRHLRGIVTFEVTTPKGGTRRA